MDAACIIAAMSTVPPRHLQEPPLATPILEWWAGCYDHAFVVLNPFFRVPGHAPATSAYSTVRTGPLSVGEIVDLVSSPQPPQPNRAPEDFDSLIKATGQPVSWDEIRRAIDAPSGMEFYRTVWLWTVQCERKDRNAVIADALSRHCDATATYSPEEDMLPAVMEPMLGRYLAAHGLETVTLWSEWRDKSLEVTVASLMPGNPALRLPRDKVAAVTAPGLIMCWAFDDVSALMAMTDARLIQADPKDFFEILSVTPDMYPDVFNPQDANPRRPGRRQ